MYSERACSCHVVAANVGNIRSLKHSGHLAALRAADAPTHKVTGYYRQVTGYYRQGKYYT